MSAVIILRFDEPNGVQPADDLGNLDNLGTQTGIVAPVQATAWTGFGRSFVQANSNALIALGGDLTPQGTVLIRDATIQVLLSLTLSGATGPQTIICRGVDDGSAAEPYSYGLEVQQQAGNPGFIEVRWFWQDSAGTIHEEPPGVFQHAGDGEEFLLTATRRWQSSTSVVVRYYVGPELIGELGSSDGDIAGATLGHMTVGGRKAAGTWGRFLNGMLDELAVYDYEMSADEVRTVWDRLATHQPAGVAMFAGLAPPGAPWAKNPGNSIGRFVKVAGQSLGGGIAEAEELRALWLPMHATLENIGGWEKLCGLSPKPNDSLDARRARVVAYGARQRGFSLPAIQAALAGPFAQAVADVDIIEFTNTITDSFDTLAPERWRIGNVGTWTSSSGVLSVAVTSGTDTRWDPTRAFSSIRLPLSAPNNTLVFQAKLASYWGTLPVNTLVGIYVYNRRSNNTMWFGVKNVGGVMKLGYQVFLNGTLGAFVVILSGIANTPVWLRIATPVTAGYVGGGLAQIFSYSTVGPNSGFTDTEVTSGLIPDIEWAGFAVMSTDAALASNLAATFDDAIAFSPNGDRVFSWYAYRDPTLAGSPDMIGAAPLVAKIKPAHTYGAPISSKSVLCDDPVNGRCDLGPCGAL